MPENESTGGGLGKLLFGSISKKLALALFAIALVGCLVGVISLIQIQKLSAPLNTELPASIAVLKNSTELDSYARFIQYYDEVLTQSARNYAFTHDKKWERRYNEIVPELDSVIKSAIEKGDVIDKEFFSKVDAANIALVEMETEALGLADNGDYEGAIAILESAEYWRQKAIYKQGLDEYLNRRGESYNLASSESTKVLENLSFGSKELLNESQRIVAIFIIVLFALAVLVAFLVNKMISRPVKELHGAALALQKGDFKARVGIKTGDELEGLGKTFNSVIAALERSDDEKKQLDKAKTEFISITSHELRSPMTPMMAQLQMLKEGYFGKLNEKQAESVDVVLRNTERLDHIIVDFLEISRIEAARLKFNFVKASLEEPIKLLIDEMNGYLPEKKIKITAKIPKLPVFEVDPDRAMQVLRNLLNNAKKFSPDNSEITVEARVSEKFLQFSVKDSGIGISKKDQIRLFEPFYQAEQTMYRKYGGTGLGLAICKGIVESQNGKIWLESEPGKGTKFSFTIPFEPVRESKPIKILFSAREAVDSRLREIFKEILGPLGLKEFEILQSQSGIEEKTVDAFAEELFKAGVLDSEKREEFKSKAKAVFLQDASEQAGEKKD